jgi:hypothetical protein
MSSGANERLKGALATSPCPVAPLDFTIAIWNLVAAAGTREHPTILRVLFRSGIDDDTTLVVDTLHLTKPKELMMAMRWFTNA